VRIESWKDSDGGWISLGVIIAALLVLIGT